MQCQEVCFSGNSCDPEKVRWNKNNFNRLGFVKCMYKRLRWAITSGVNKTSGAQDCHDF